jgi:lipoprotein-releasing system ATP-binding protein
MIIQAKALHKKYSGGDDDVLVDASLSVGEGDCIALLGASGSGKSTLLNCLGLLDRFDSGTLMLFGQDVNNLSESQRARFRLEHIGFVFQFHHLIPELSAEENVRLPASMLGRNAGKEAAELLDLVGLGDKKKRFPWQLSGGEQQRVALARALVNRPKLVLTDEATGNLDRPRALEVVEMLLKINREFRTTLFSVTHDEEFAKKYSKQYRLKDGRIWVG